MLTRSSSLRSFSFFVLGSAALLGAQGCGSDRPSSSSQSSTCEQYLGCLDAVGASGGAAASAYRATIDQARAQYQAGGACDTNEQTRSQCELACSSGLTSAAQAFPSLSGCTAQPHTMAGPGAGGGGSGPCKAYLSCVLATSPSTYAQALTVYGDKAACWDTEAQSASCDAACGASLGELKDVCSCTGSTCTAYHQLTSGEYGYTVTRTSSDTTCPAIAMSSHGANLTRYSNTSYQIQGTVQSTENSPFGGPMTFTDEVEGKITINGNSGSIAWTINGEPRGGGAVLITADDAFEAGLDRYGDTSCVYRVAFTKK